MPPKKSDKPVKAKTVTTKAKTVKDKPVTTKAKTVADKPVKAKTVKDKPVKAKQVTDKPVDSNIIPIILESPNKIKKIISFLPYGKYIVLASCGHFRELSNTYNGMGFSVDSNGVKVDYIEQPSKKQIISNLKKTCKTSNTIYLATDPDREGEAIAWHIMELLGKKKDYYRITFNSITRNEVLKALEAPSRIDMNLVLAQQTRKIMDKWIGFKVSPECWTNVSKSAKSAGRVQSPALKLLVEREREILNFKPVEYFTITATFNIVGHHLMKSVDLHTYLDMKKPLHFEREEVAMEVITNIDNSCKTWVLNIKEDETKVNPPPPYTTLTILQDCFTYLKLKPEQTMFMLQKMYESGWITYHRTDSVVLSKEGLFATRKALEDLHPELLSDKLRNYTNKDINAQEAHEPIRPTHYDIVNLTNLLEEEKDKSKLDPRIAKIYSMIYFRTLATQAKPLINTNIVFNYIGKKDIEFAKSFTFLKENGWKTLYADKEINLFNTTYKNEVEPIPKWILEIQNKKTLTATLEEFELENHFTKPPNYFNSSTLINTLEHLGIGRPSTYASIITKLFENKYIYEKDSRLHPSEVGAKLVDYLETRYKTHFMNLEYTRLMEKTLDNIAGGKSQWERDLLEFVNGFPN